MSSDLSHEEAVLLLASLETILHGNHQRTCLKIEFYCRKPNYTKLPLLLTTPREDPAVLCASFPISGIANTSRFAWCMFLNLFVYKSSNVALVKLLALVKTRGSDQMCILLLLMLFLAGSYLNQPSTYYFHFFDLCVCVVLWEGTEMGGGSSAVI